MQRLLPQFLIVLILFAGFVSAVDAYILHANVDHNSCDGASVFDNDQSQPEPLHGGLDEHGCCHAAAHFMGFAPAIQSLTFNTRTSLAFFKAPIESSNTSKIPTPPPRS